MSERRLDRLIAKAGAEFHTEPKRYQKACFLLGLKYNAYLFWLDPGLGKTKVTLDLLAHAKRTGNAERALVLVPNTSNILSWQNEVKRHAPSLSFAGMDGDRADRLEVVDSDADVVVCTYAGFLALVCGRVKGRNGKGKMEVDPSLLKRLVADRFGAAVLDESTAVQNPRSLTFRACDRWMKHCRLRFALTGTPFGTDPASLWSQFYLIDRGETLGETLGVFRSACFVERPNPWTGWPEYTFDPRRKAWLNRAIRNRSIRYHESECSELPGKVFVDRPVVFPSEIKAYYDKVVNELREANGNFRLLDNAFTRMRQLASGFLTVKDPEGERVVVKFKNNPKLEALLEFLDEVPPERKIVVFNEYQVSGDMIAQALKTKKVKHVRLYSGTRDKKHVQRRFIEDPSVRVMLSSTAGAFGNNWQVANYVAWYELPTSPILFKQELKRCHRIGQTRTTFFYKFMVRGSIDEKINRSLLANEDLFRQVVENGDVNRVI